MTVTEEAAKVVRIERTFDAPAEEVFDAWTSEEVIGRWFHRGGLAGGRRRGGPARRREGPGRDADPDGGEARRCER